MDRRCEGYGVIVTPHYLCGGCRAEGYYGPACPAGLPVVRCLGAGIDVEATRERLERLFAPPNVVQGPFTLNFRSSGGSIGAGHA